MSHRGQNRPSLWTLIREAELNHAAALSYECELEIEEAERKLDQLHRLRNLIRLNGGIA